MSIDYLKWTGKNDSPHYTHTISGANFGVTISASSTLSQAQANGHTYTDSNPGQLQVRWRVLWTPALGQNLTTDPPPTKLRLSLTGYLRKASTCANEQDAQYGHRSTGASRSSINGTDPDAYSYLVSGVATAPMTKNHDFDDHTDWVVWSNQPNGTAVGYVKMPVLRIHTDTNYTVDEYYNGSSGLSVASVGVTLTASTEFSVGQFKRHVSLASFSGDLTDLAARVTVTSCGTTTVLDRQDCVLGADGYFDVTLSVSNGTYDVYVSVPGYLPVKLSSVSITSGGDSNGSNSLSLTNGDIDGSASIDSTDLGLVTEFEGYDSTSSDWFTVGVDGSCPADADVNGDGVVDTSDYTVVYNNLGSSATSVPLATDPDVGSGG